MAGANNDDTFVAMVQSYFEAFLTSYSSDMGKEVEPSSAGADEDEVVLEYVEQFNAMRETERTTLFVDYQHLFSHDSELADAVREQFHFLEPHLRASVGKVMASLHEVYAAEKDFHVSFFNLPHLCAIRELRTDKIATLAAFTGTVTRTTDVRVGPLSSVDDAFAWDEGEGDRSRAYWLDVHTDCFARAMAALGQEMHADIPVVFERFEVL